jgi:hypothetical protein
VCRVRAYRSADRQWTLPAPCGHDSLVPNRPSDCCPNLAQVLGSYLHQDWDLDHTSADDALLAAIAGQPPRQVAAAASELLAHRPPADDEAASRRFSNELCSYHPPGDGLTYSAWLDRVQHILTADR